MGDVMDENRKCFVIYHPSPLHFTREIGPFESGEDADKWIAARRKLYPGRYQINSLDNPEEVLVLA